MMKRRDRRDSILSLLRGGEVHSIGEMADMLEVSGETVRRELRIMEDAGTVERLHGGARIVRSVEEGPFDARMRRNSESKQRIAAAATARVEDGQTLYIDASSTSFYIARELRLRRDLTIVTNALNVAYELGGRRGNRLFAASGELDEGYRAFFDETARDYLRRFRPSLAILSTQSVHPGHGFTNYHLGEATISQQMIAQSERVMMAMDASKFDRLSPIAVARFDEIDMLVTDARPGPEYRDVLGDVALIGC